MMKMRISQDEARQLIHEIPHNTCQKGVQTCWIEGGKAGVTAQSICWLFCWAKTGMNSAKAAQQSKQVFDQIFNHSYEWFSDRVPHEWARQARYERGDIESELTNLLAG